MIYVLSGGGTGGTLVVTGVAGDTVTATKDGKSYKRTFNASGIATFKGLKTGTWAITMTDGSQSVTQNVTINADYTLTMAYFSALITTTWPEGSTCSCTDGTSTLYAPDTSGSYTFNVPNKGTWTVTATNGDKTASKSVSITAEGQVETIELLYALYIFKEGEGAVTPMTVKAQSGVSASITDDVITLNYPYGVTQYVVAEALNQTAIDLTNFNTLYIDMVATRIENSTTYGTHYGVFSNDLLTGYVSNNFVAGEQVKATFTRTVKSVDLSNINGNYFVGVKGAMTAKVYNIWLE